MTPLRERMIEDMALRDFSPKTREAYVGAVADLARFYNRSPNRLSEEEVRGCFVDLVALPVIQRLLGHAKVETTTIYTHLTDPTLERLSRALDEITEGF